MTAPSLETGQSLGPYRIISFLAAGGMGAVYRAHDPRTGRDVAIKVAAQQFSERFTREVRAVAALNHPNICTLYDVGPDYLVMELVGSPRELFEKDFPFLNFSYDVANQGRRFLMLKSVPGGTDAENPRNEYHVVTNWVDELRRRVPSAR
jgi:serine/threonine protein kinase